MEPNKPASDPPLRWTEVKNSVDQPPLYQSCVYPGPSHPVNPPQAQGFGALPQYGMRHDQPPYSIGQQYPPQPGIITVQPVVTVTRAPLESPVSDYLGYSILTMLCCCLPLGIAALIQSLAVRDANIRGDRMAAEQTSRTALMLNNVALGLGLITIISTIGIVVVAFMNF